MEQIHILITKRTKTNIDKKRGDVPLSIFIRKLLEVQFK